MATKQMEMEWKMDEINSNITAQNARITNAENAIRYAVKDMEKALKKNEFYKVNAENKTITRNLQYIKDSKAILEELAEQKELLQRNLDGFGPIQEYLEEVLQRDVEWHKELRAATEGKTTKEIFNEYGQNKVIVLFAKTSEAEALKMFKDDLNARYNKLKKQIGAVVGNVESFDLVRNDNMSLDGIVIGDEGRASIATHGAGGYNIQRFHFRTKVKAVKK